MVIWLLLQVTGGPLTTVRYICLITFVIILLAQYFYSVLFLPYLFNLQRLYWFVCFQKLQALEGTRTLDPQIKSLMLYRLSYQGNSDSEDLQFIQF